VADKVCIAQIGAAHGVRGEVRLKAFTEDPLGVTRYGALETDDGGGKVVIEAVRPAKNMLVARIKGVTDRNAADALKNVRLYVAREKLPKPDADEFYHADLIGLAAETPNGEPVGTVKAIHNFGAGDLIEIEPAHGGATVVWPFDETTVPVVDLAGRRIVVEPPVDG
jgi:16S rRNA processing protein RimM